MTDTMTRSIERNDATIAYRRDGSGPPLLLFHATLSSSRQLRPLATRLAARFDVVRVDRRGSGDTAALAGQDTDPGGPIDVSVHVADVVAIADTLGLDPAIVVGHSYGGCIALELAARQPASVTAAWVFEPPYAVVGPPPAQEAMAAVSRSTAEAAQAGGAGAAAEAFLVAVSGQRALDAMSPSARERVRRAGPAAIADAALLGMDPERLAGIDCPVVIAYGTASDPVYAAIATGLGHRIPGSRLMAIEDADHMAPLTRSDVVAAEVEALVGT